MNTRIISLKAREILDSRGNPTIETTLKTAYGLVRASVPSGISTGIHEALELRDGGRRYLGKGVLNAVRNINKKIAPKIRGMNCTNQKKIDSALIKLDGTANKSKLGANAILAVSMAVCKAGALCSKTPLYKYIAELAKNKKPALPAPFLNIINGGKHADNKLAFQEFMIVPKAKKFSKAIQLGAETYHILKMIIKKKFTSAGVGDEGGFAPPIETAEQALDLLQKAIEKAGYKARIKIAIDAAASEFHKHGFYYIPKQKKRAELAHYYLRLIGKYPIISIEDPFAEDDFGPWTLLTKIAGNKIQIVGDDLTVTNPERIKKAAKLRACNALLLKINQIGTITEALQAAALAKKNKWNIMVSHRSGETCDSFIADLAVGLGCRQIKAGAPCRGERLAKYNRLLRIEEEI